MAHRFVDDCGAVASSLGGLRRKVAALSFLFVYLQECQLTRLSAYTLE